MTAPSIPTIGNSFESHSAVLRAVREALELYDRRTPNLLDSFVSVRDLAELGFLRLIGRELVSAVPQFAAPVLLNSWENYVVGSPSAGFVKAGYYKSPLGFVHLQGVIRNGSAVSGTTLFTLPVGCRPGGRHIFCARGDIAGDTAIRVDVDADGDVLIITGSNTYVSLCGLSFPAEQ